MKPQFKKRYYRNLFTWKELENLINIRPLLTDKRVYILESGKNYEWENSLWAKDRNCYPPSLFKELLDNHVCYLDDMSRCTEKINSFASKLEKEYKLSVDAHIYICRRPKIDHPFGKHFDRSHNVIVQCEGTTNFKVWNRVLNGQDPNVISDNLDLNDPPILDVDMKPGDAIWIPAYYPHLATSKSIRMSVSFPLGLEPDPPYEDRTWIKL